MTNQKLWGRCFAATVLILPCAFSSAGCGGSSSHSEPVDQTQTTNNLKSLTLALDQYTEDYDDQMPNVTTPAGIKTALMPYTHNSTVFVDPINNVPFGWNASLSGKVPATYPDGSLIITFYDAQPPVANSIPVSLLNSQTQLVTSAQFTQLKSTSGIP